MQRVFTKANLEAIDIVGLVNLRKLIGDYTIIGHDYTSPHNDVIIISFYTDKLTFEEGESRQVDVIFKCSEDGKYKLEEIKKMQSEVWQKTI